MEGGGWVVSDQAVHSLQALELQTDHSVSREASGYLKSLAFLRVLS